MQVIYLVLFLALTSLQSAASVTVCELSVCPEEQSLVLNHCQGSLPTEIAQVSRLKELSVVGDGPLKVPTEIGSLEHLQSLNLTGNALDELPSQIGNLRSLQQLFVERTGLNELPTELGRLKLLRILYANDNNHSILPTQLGQLLSLSEVDLSGNSIRILPSEMGELKALQLLFVFNNGLRKLPSEVGRLTSLLRLAAFDNDIRSIVPEIGNLHNLLWLEVEGNRLRDLPTQIGSLRSLEMLTVDDQPLSHLPTEIGLISTLTFLNVSWCMLTRLPTEIGNLAALADLYLEGNHLVEAPTQLRKLPSLHHPNELLFVDLAPRNISVDFLSDSDIRFEFDHADKDQIEQYEVLMIANSSGASIRKQQYFKIPIASFYGLDTNATHSFKVRARAKRPSWLLAPLPYSEWSREVTLHTCPTNMLARNTEECIGRHGFFSTADGTAKSCNQLSRDLVGNPVNVSACDSEGLTVEGLPVEPGYWRPSMTSEDVRQCPRLDYCKQLSNVSGSTDTYCSEGHKGTYCSACIKGYGLTRTGCVRCDDDSALSEEKMFLFGAMLVVLMMLLLYGSILLSSGILTCDRRVYCKSKNRKQRKKKALVWPAAWVKFRILCGYFQVVLSFERTFQRNSLDGSNSEFSGILRFITGLAVDYLLEGTTTRCVYNYNHYDVLLVMTLFPICTLIGLLVLCFLTTLFRPEKGAVLMSSWTSVCLFLLFLVYPVVSETILATFWCESFRDADLSMGLTKSALRSDYRISCSTTEDERRQGYVIYAGFMVVLYPIGIPVLYISLLWSYRKALLTASAASDSNGKESIKRVAFLTNPYISKRYWYEGYELLRKLCQTSIVGFLQELQLDHISLATFLPLIAQNTCIVFTGLLLWFKPYKRASDFSFAVLSMLMLIPATQLSLLDPVEVTSIASNGMTVLYYLQVALFFAFLLVEYLILNTGLISCARAYSVPKLEDGGDPKTSNDAAGSNHLEEVNTTTKEAPVTLV